MSNTQSPKESSIAHLAKILNLEPPTPYSQEINAHDFGIV